MSTGQSHTPLMAQRAGNESSTHSRRLAVCAIPGILFSVGIGAACLAAGTAAHLDRGLVVGADLRGADLQGANLQEANQEGANLQETFLWHANLQGARLQGVDLTGAIGLALQQIG